jgi:hypothetical protein
MSVTAAKQLQLSALLVPHSAAANCVMMPEFAPALLLTATPMLCLCAATVLIIMHVHAPTVAEYTALHLKLQILLQLSKQSSCIYA